MKFGTPRFLAFSDGVALSMVKAKMNYSGAKINRLRILDRIEPQDRDAYNEDKKECIENEARIKETIRNHENSIPGYLDEEDAYNELYVRLHSAEVSRKEINSGITQTGSPNVLKEDPSLYTGAQLSVEVDLTLCQKLEDIRKVIIKKANKQS